MDDQLRLRAPTSGLSKTPPRGRLAMKTATASVLVALTLGLLGISPSAAGEAPPAPPATVGKTATGACCLGKDGCIELTPMECAAQGGTYLGDGIICAANPCALSPVIGVDLTSLDFGRVCQAQCRDLGIQIFNNVSDPTSQLHVTDLSATAPFSLVDPPQIPFDIPGDGTRVLITIRYCPSTPGPHSGTFNITASNAINSPLDVPLSGIGNRPPVCNAGGPYMANQWQPIEFDGTGSSDPDGDPLVYLWDFGDGGAATGPTPTHIYEAPGDYTVTLSVIDSCLVVSTCETQAHIVPNLPPVCDAGGPYWGTVGKPIVFDGTGSSDPEGGALTYGWDFGDGWYAYEPTPTHVYGFQGNYSVTLCVTDTAGARTCCQTTAYISQPTTPCSAPIWNEQDDAGDLPSTAQFISLSGPVLAIAGTLSSSTDVDMYHICMYDPRPFQATTCEATGFDTQLWLFYDFGYAITFNDNAALACPGDLQSTITGQFAYPFGGEFLIAISGSDRDATNEVGAEIWNDDPRDMERPPDGPGAPGPVAGWSGPGMSGAYCISLSQVFAYCPVTVVELTRFEATAVPGGVLVSWEARSTEDVVGYDVLAAPAAEGPYVKRNAELLPAEAREYVDVSVGTSFYQLQILNRDGLRSSHGPVTGVAGPPSTALLGNSPNPFSERTEIRFSAPPDQRVTINIYDVRGALVARVYDALGGHVAVWDGRNAGGQRVVPGIYFYQMNVGGRSLAKKLAVFSER